MKTIEQGEVPESPQDWWVGQRVRCTNCFYVGEIEAGDELKPGFRMLAERRINGKRTITTRCPTCHLDIFTEVKPQK